MSGAESSAVVECETSSSSTRQDAEAPTDSASAPESFLLIHNLKSKNNVGNMLRSAVAFGVKEVILYGGGKVATFGSHMSRHAIKVKKFPKLEDAVAYLKARPGGCSICGVEIDPKAQPVHTHPFSGSTCFMLGNEGQGLEEYQLKRCDQLVYISQYGEGTASLNVCVAGSIVLHHFGLWAGKTESKREGQKFVVVQESGRDRYLNRTAEEEAEFEERRAQRREKREAAAAAAAVAAADGDATVQEGAAETEGAQIEEPAQA